MVNPLWIMQGTGNVLQQPYVITHPSIQFSVKPTLTNDQRFTGLMTTFQPLAHLASQSNPDTQVVKDTLNALFDKLSTKEECSTKSSNGQAQMVGKELIANPRTMTKQSQVRKQPHASGAPTTIANKNAARKSERDRKATRKAAEATAHGQL